MGLTGAEIAARLFSSFGSRAAQVCALCLEEEAERLSVLGGKIYPGIEAMLKELYPKAGLYIVSNCQRGYIESFPAWAGISAPGPARERQGFQRRRISGFWPPGRACAALSMWEIQLRTKRAPGRSAALLFTRATVSALPRLRTPFSSPPRSFPFCWKHFKIIFIGVCHV